MNNVVNAGAVELWELTEDERLLVNRFSKHEHDHIVTSVSSTTDGTHAVSGSMDCKFVHPTPPIHRLNVITTQYYVQTHNFGGITFSHASF